MEIWCICMVLQCFHGNGNCVEISLNYIKLSAVKEKAHEYPLYTIETFQSRFIS